jgi:N-acetyl-anhydromuramyl-L-alanine amidase AmpD
MTYYHLLDPVNPPRLIQYRYPRRAVRSGVCVIHTFEKKPDLTLPDDGAEAGARFIRDRADRKASYHAVCDSDSVADLVPTGKYEAFHDATGTNRHSIGFSFACHAHQWDTAALPEWWVAGAMEQAGRWWAAQIEDIRNVDGVLVPLQRITAEQARAKVPGFITHAELDPGRRSDPGPRFPWSRFFDSIASHFSPLQEVDDMSDTVRQQAALAAMFDAYLWLRRPFADGTDYPHPDRPDPSAEEYWRQRIDRAVGDDAGKTATPKLDAVNRELRNLLALERAKLEQQRGKQ